VQATGIDAEARLKLLKFHFHKRAKVTSISIGWQPTTAEIEETSSDTIQSHYFSPPNISPKWQALI
jgi:hypothetical protein